MAGERRVSHAFPQTTNRCWTNALRVTLLRSLLHAEGEHACVPAETSKGGVIAAILTSAEGVAARRRVDVERAGRVVAPAATVVGVRAAESEDRQTLPHRAQRIGVLMASEDDAGEHI